MSALKRFLSKADSEPVICVTIVETKGSTPRNEGALMLVSHTETFGTIGGGALELLAIERARSMLLAGETSSLSTHQLGPSINQCCGGTVSLQMELLNAGGCERLLKEESERHDDYPHIIIFGAGHVGLALAKALDMLPFNTILTDTRPDMLGGLSYMNNLYIKPHALPEQLVREAKDGTAFVIVTHDHDLDFNIMSEVLLRNDCTYIGLIGSKTKRANFKTRFLKNNGSNEAFEKLICPIGVNSTHDKRPEVIAAFVAAELCATLLAPDGTSQ